MAEVTVRVGLNLQPGQPLLITDPYDLQGVHPEATPLVEAVRTAAGGEVKVFQSDPLRLRSLVEAGDASGFESLVSVHTSRLRQHLARGGAFLFLTGSAPRLLDGLPAGRLRQFARIKWRHLGPFIQQLIRGASQWTLVPAPSSAWADAAFADLPAAARLPALWETVFEVLRVTGSNVGGSLSPDPALSGHKAPPTKDTAIAAWETHLASLSHRRDELNAARHRHIRYTGPGTDLTLDLPRSHVWCTAQLTTKSGVPFVANLPTEEVFTAPHKNSATGTVRVARPVSHGGAVIDGIELEFRRGRVSSARARTGDDLLQQLLATDSGACRLGEVAIIVGGALGPDGLRTESGPKAPPTAGTWQTSGRFFHHTLLDENATNHIALGDAYRFCSRAWVPLALNSSQVHLDLPLDATAELL